jgi:hypothetical protein
MCSGRTHRRGGAWWRSPARRQLGIASGGRRAPLDLAATHSGWKRGGGGRSRAINDEVVMVVGGNALQDLSGHRLWRRKGQ